MTDDIKNDLKYLIIRKHNNNKEDLELDRINSEGYAKIPILIVKDQITDVIIISKDNAIVGSAQLKGISIEKMHDKIRYHYQLSENKDDFVDKNKKKHISHLSFQPYQVQSTEQIKEKII